MAARLWQWAGAFSIRIKVLGIVIGVIVLLSTFVIVQMRGVLLETLLDDLAHQGAALATGVADLASEMERHEDEVQSLVVERQTHYSSSSHNTSVLFIYILNEAGERIGATGAPFPPQSVLSQPPIMQTHETEARLYENTLIFTRAVPDTRWMLYVGLDSSSVRATVDGVTAQLLLLTAGMIIVGLLAASLLTWVLTRPLLDLVEATHAVARGDFARRVRRWADDEIGDLATAFNGMTQALGDAQAARAERDRLRAEYITHAIQAQENERQRIARELHDSTSQSLTSLLVGLQNLKAAPTPDEMICRIDDLRETLTHTLDEVRSISWRLRPAALDDLGLRSALENYIEDYRRRHGLQVDFVMRAGAGRLPAEVETAVYRIVQECLTNTARYAGAKSASVFIGQRDHTLRVIVEDDGRGFDVDTILQNSRSLGLKGIRERAALFGGTFHVESNPGTGTSVVVEIPLREVTL